MALNVTALVTAAELREHLGAKASDDPKLETLANAVSAAIEKYCSNVFVQRTVTETQRGGKKPWHLGGAKRMQLHTYPVVSVTSITDVDSNTVDAADYTVIGDYGWLEHDGYWPVPVGFWSVVYVAGAFADTESVDDGLKMAAKTVASRYWKAGSLAGGRVSSRRLGDKATSYFNPRAGGDGGIVLTADEQFLLGSWIRHDV